MNQARVQAALSRFGGLSLREFSIVVALMLPTTMALIEVGMVGVALPVIQAAFGVPVDLLSWVMAVGYLLRVPLMPVYGRFGDVFGKKYLYLIGLVIFIMGALIGATAQTFGWLIRGRLLQGLGSAASLPLAMALIAEAFPEEQHGRALGIWNTSAPVGLMLGPVLGGILVESFGWHMIFIVVASLAVVSFGVVTWLVPSPPKPDTRPKVDWFGAVMLALAIGGLLLATTTASVVAFGSALNIAFWVVTVLALSALIWNGTHRLDPFIGFDVLRNRQFMTPALAVSLRTFAHDGIRFLVVLYLANVFGLTPKTIGFFMLFYAFPLFIGIASGGFLADRWPSRVVGAIGMFLFAMGVLWPGLVDPNHGSLLLAPGVIVAGVSAGVSLTPFTKTAVTSLGRDQIGFAAGLYNTLRFAGIATSTPLLGLLLASGFARYGGLETVSRPYQSGFQLLAVVTLVGSGVALLIPNESERVIKS